MVDNKIDSIKRQIVGRYTEKHPIDIINESDAKMIELEIGNYYTTHPKVFVPNAINYNLGTVKIKEMIPWYFGTYD